MKISELRKKSPAELEVLLRENKEKIREWRFKITSRQLKNLRLLRQSRKIVAKILTILHESRI